LVEVLVEEVLDLVDGVKGLFVLIDDDLVGLLFAFPTIGLVGEVMLEIRLKDMRG
jgi:hypothetical protein